MLWRRGKAYSQDLRERILAAADDGRRVGEIAAVFRVSVSYVSKVLSRRRRTGVTTALPQRCHVPRKLAGLQWAIGERVGICPDATLSELQAWLARTHQVTASTGLLCRTLAGLRLTYKKSRSMRRSRTGRTLPRHAPHGARTSQA